MRKCKICGKPIPDSIDVCGECARNVSGNPALSSTQKDYLSQFDKGFGSVRREQNIRLVAQMLKDGMSEEDVRDDLSLLFKQSTVDDYIRVAKILLRKGRV